MLKRLFQSKLSFLFVLVMMLGLCLQLELPGVKAAADETQFFSQTGHSVSGKFLDYWRQNGGLSVFGYPITDAKPEVDPETGKTFLTQWFERNRFELHPENAGTKYEVLLGLLGKDLRREALAVDPDFQPAGPAIDFSQPLDAQRYFPETKHNLRFGFLNYWNTNGGLERFGYPIDEEHQEVDPQTGQTFVSQWFERARFEYHPENKAPYDILLGLLGNQLKNPSSPVEFSWKIGGGYTHFFQPIAIGLDGLGNLLVSDYLNKRLLKFIGGEPGASNWSRPGLPPSFTGITGDKDGNVYLVNRTDQFIEKFDSQGKLLARIGSPGKGNGQFSWPEGLALDPSGNLYVCDRGNSRIEKFDNAGNFVAVWGADNGNSLDSSAIAIDDQGNVFVTNDANFQILKFDSAGHLLLKWGSLGTGQGQFGKAVGRFLDIPISQIGPTSISVDNLGRVFVADPSNDRIEVFDEAGNYKSQIASSSEYSFNGLGYISAGKNGLLYVADYYNYRVLVLDSSTGKLVSQLGAGFNAPGQFNPDLTGGPATIAVDAQNNFYVGDVGNHRIQKFNNQAKILATWGSQGNGDGQFGVIEGSPGLFLNVAVDSQGNTYVSDPANYRVEKFDPAGHFLLKWGGNGNGNGQFGDFKWPGGPGGIAVDPQNNVWVIDSGSARVQKFDSQGHYLTTLGIGGLSDGQFVTPFAIASDRQGNIFVADDLRIQKFDSAGHFITKFGNGARGIALDAQGNVYLSGTRDNKLWKFDNNGKWLFEWGGSGNSDGLFSNLGGPSGIAVDGQGSVFVADERNNRVQKFVQHSLQ